MSECTVNGVVMPSFRGQQPREVAVDLADEGVRAGDVHAVASRRGRVRSDEVIALLDGEHEEGVALVDPVLREPVEELSRAARHTSSITISPP
jgi:hypothetical protein